MARPELRYPDVTAHRLVAEVAVRMAEEIYDELCSGSNVIYRVHANRKDFIQQCAPTLRDAARVCLTKLLADPDTSELEKEKIYDALILDRQLPRTGTSIVHKRDYH